MSNVGFNNEYQQLKLRYLTLKEQVANQIELYTNLVNVVGPNLEAMYMVQIGKFEAAERKLAIEARRWKKRIALRQQYLNRGEKPDYVAIENMLDEEFKEYAEELKELIEMLKASSTKYYSTRISREESAALRCAYLDAVKKLHPDINPDLPPHAVDLWNQIQTAYSEEDWPKVRFLATLVDSVVSEDGELEPSPDATTEIKALCERLEARSRNVAEEMAKMKKHTPYSYEELLTDRELVEERLQEIGVRTNALKRSIEKYKEIWNNGL